MVAIPRVAFVGGGEGGEGFLRVLAEFAADGRCEIVAAVATHLGEQAHPRIASLCASAGIKQLSSVADIATAGPLDVVISSGNHAIFNDDLLSLPRNGVVNFHAAPLPEYRGSACPSFAILNHEREFGVTFIRADRGLDTGPILHVHRFAIPDECTAAELDRRCVEVGVDAFRRIGLSLIRGEMPPMAQPPASKPPYRRKDIEQFRRVDLSWPADRIWRHIRACDWNGVIEPAYAEIEGRRVYVTTSARGTWLPS